MSISKKIIEDLAVTAELCCAEMSEGAARVMCAELAVYPEQAVLGALSRLRREHQGKFTLAAIIARLDDGRPGVEEAWALYPKEESESAAVTTEMQESMYAACELLQDGDRIAARMAFKQTYERLVSQNRAERIPVKWLVTLGHDKNGRESALIDATRRGLIGADHAMRLLPSDLHERFCESIGQPQLLPANEKGISHQGVKRVQEIVAQVSGGALTREENISRMAALRETTGI